MKTEIKIDEKEKIPAYEECNPPESSSEWCNPMIYGVDNTMCKYPACPQKRCGEVLARGINDQVDFSVWLCPKNRKNLIFEVLKNLFF